MQTLILSKRSHDQGTRRSAETAREGAVVAESGIACLTVFVLVTLSLLTASPTSAQSVSGSAGLTAKGYSASGIADRRAPGALEAFARLSFDLSGLTSGVNLSYSTDDSGVRQSINKFAFKTAWNSGALALGDVSTSYSPYSMSGITTRGGSIEQSLGPLFIGFSGGRSRRAVDVSQLESFRGASFSRYVVGSRFGLGQPDGSHFHLITVYGKDKANSVSDPGDLRPAANLSLTPSVAAKAFGGALSVAAQVTGSVFTADHTQQFDSDSPVPSFLHSFVNEGSSYDFAGNLDVAVQQPDYGVSASFIRIQPGFQSLGLTQIRSDEQSIRIAPRFRAMNGRVNVSGSVGRARNNLYQNLLTTLERDQLDAAVQVQVSRSLSVAAAANLLRNTSAPSAAGLAIGPAIELQQKQVGRTILLSPTLLLQSPSGVSHTVSLSASQQSFDDKSDAVLAGNRTGFSSTNKSLLGIYSIRFPSSFSVTATGNLVQSYASTSDATIRNGTLSLGFRPIDNLATTLTGGWSSSTLTSTSQQLITTRSGTQWSGGLTASYTVSRSTALRLNVRGIANRSNQDFSNFEEVQSSLSLTQRF